MTMIQNGLIGGRLWNDFFGTGAILLPKADVKETKEAFIVEADLPGVKKEDVELVCENGVLTIGAKIKQEQPEDVRVLRKERFEGDIRRRFILKDIEEENISAKFENGVLSVTLPKKAPEERRIEIE